MQPAVEKHQAMRYDTLPLYMLPPPCYYSNMHSHQRPASVQWLQVAHFRMASNKLTTDQLSGDRGHPPPAHFPVNNSAENQVHWLLGFVHCYATIITETALITKPQACLQKSHLPHLDVPQMRSETWGHVCVCANAWARSAQHVHVGAHK